MQTGKQDKATTENQTFTPIDNKRTATALSSYRGKTSGLTLAKGQ
jgi:hypothetical protein